MTFTTHAYISDPEQMFIPTREENAAPAVTEPPTAGAPSFHPPRHLNAHVVAPGGCTHIDMGGGIHKSVSHHVVVEGPARSLVYLLPQ